MAQMMRGQQEDEPEQAQILNSRPQEASKPSQHDKLCDSMHEKVLSSDLAVRNISTLTLQDGRRSLSMQERGSKGHSFPNVKRD